MDCWVINCKSNTCVNLKPLLIITVLKMMEHSESILKLIICWLITILIAIHVNNKRWILKFVCVLKGIMDTCVRMLRSRNARFISLTHHFMKDVQIRLTLPTICTLFKVLILVILLIIRQVTMLRHAFFVNTSTKMAKFHLNKSKLATTIEMLYRLHLRPILILSSMQL